MSAPAGTHLRSATFGPQFIRPPVRILRVAVSDEVAIIRKHQWRAPSNCETDLAGRTVANNNNFQLFTPRIWLSVRHNNLNVYVSPAETQN